MSYKVFGFFRKNQSYVWQPALPGTLQQLQEAGFETKVFDLDTLVDRNGHVPKADHDQAVNRIVDLDEQLRSSKLREADADHSRNVALRDLAASRGTLATYERALSTARKERDAALREIERLRSENKNMRDQTDKLLNERDSALRAADSLAREAKRAPQGQSFPEMARTNMLLADERNKARAELKEKEAELAVIDSGLNAQVRELDLLLNGPDAESQASLCDLISQLRALKPTFVPVGVERRDIEASVAQFNFLREDHVKVVNMIVNLLSYHDEKKASAVLRSVVAEQSSREVLEGEAKKAVRKVEPFAYSDAMRAIRGNGIHVNIGVGCRAETLKLVGFINQLIKFNSVIEPKTVSPEKQRAERKAQDALKFVRGMLHGWHKGNAFMFQPEERKKLEKMLNSK